MEQDPIDFYKDVTKGIDKTKTISLTLDNGRKLDGVEIHPVSKQALTDTMNRLPEAMFDAVEEADSTEEAEAKLEEESDLSMNNLTGDTITAFEDLCKESLQHPQLASAQMRDIVDGLNFEALFGIGNEVIEMSGENDGKVTDFHVQE